MLFRLASFVTVKSLRTVASLILALAPTYKSCVNETSSETYILLLNEASVPTVREPAIDAAPFMVASFWTYKVLFKLASLVTNSLLLKVASLATASVLLNDAAPVNVDAPCTSNVLLRTAAFVTANVFLIETADKSDVPVTYKSLLRDASFDTNNLLFNVTSFTASNVSRMETTPKLDEPATYNPLLRDASVDKNNPPLIDKSSAIINE